MNNYTIITFSAILHAAKREPIFNFRSIIRAMHVPVVKFWFVSNPGLKASIVRLGFIRCDALPSSTMGSSSLSKSVSISSVSSQS